MPEPHTPSPPSEESVELISSFAHDFNNLLGIILGGLSLLEEDLPATTADPELQAILADTLSAAREASVLVARLTASVGRQIIDADGADLNAIVRDSEQILAARLPQGVTLSVRVATGSLPAWTDARRLRECLIELVDNAVRAMRGRGNIVVRCDRIDDSPRIRVEDDGPGMDADELARCTRPYVTSWRGEGCRGLGLGAVHGVMLMCAGSLHVHSEPGSGTAVELRFATPESGALRTTRAG